MRGELGQGLSHQAAAGTGCLKAVWQEENLTSMCKGTAQERVEETWKTLLGLRWVF